MSNPRITKKEYGLLKGALRRVFSRSELRAQALEAALVPGHYDSKRPRVTKWAKCPICKEMTPAYLMQVDHTEPFVPLDVQFHEMSIDEAVDRLWCERSNLVALCKPCHKQKTKIENKERKLLAKGKLK